MKWYSKQILLIDKISKFISVAFSLLISVELCGCVSHTPGIYLIIIIMQRQQLFLLEPFTITIVTSTSAIVTLLYVVTYEMTLFSCLVLLGKGTWRANIIAIDDLRHYRPPMHFRYINKMGLSGLGIFRQEIIFRFHYGCSKHKYRFKIKCHAVVLKTEGKFSRSDVQVTPELYYHF